VYKHRFLIVKRPENYQGKDSDNLSRMYEYLPGLRLLRGFCLEVYQLFDPQQLARLGRRRTLLLKKAEYQQDPELQAALGLLDKEKFDKMIALLECPVGQRVRTNNHVERANCKLCPSRPRSAFLLRRRRRNVLARGPGHRGLGHLVAVTLHRGRRR
jgi:hypothetical protein